MTKPTDEGDDIPLGNSDWVNSVASAALDALQRDYDATIAAERPHSQHYLPLVMKHCDNSTDSDASDDGIVYQELGTTQGKIPIETPKHMAVY